MNSLPTQSESILVEQMTRLNSLYKNGIKVLKETEQTDRLHCVDQKLHAIMERIQAIRGEIDFASQLVKTLLATSPVLRDLVAMQRQLVEHFLAQVQTVENQLLTNREGLTIRRDRQQDFRTMQAAYRQAGNSTQH